LFYKPQGLDLFFETVFLLPQNVYLLVFVFVTVFLDLFCLKFFLLFLVVFLDSLLFVLKFIFQKLNLFFELIDLCFETFLFVDENGQFKVEFVGEVLERMIWGEGSAVEWKFCHG
jgi:hypothetical protein